MERRGPEKHMCSSCLLLGLRCSTCLPITSILARRRCLFADLLFRASSRNDATPVATALRSRLFASVYVSSAGVRKYSGQQQT